MRVSVEVSVCVWSPTLGGMTEDAEVTGVEDLYGGMTEASEGTREGRGAGSLGTQKQFGA